MRIEIETEEDGKFIAEVPAIPGAMVYGDTADEAIRKVESLALRILADCIDAGEDSEELPYDVAVPNAETIKALEDSRSGLNLERFDL
jgi:predicted RNase H-like HicB family nuclease